MTYRPSSFRITPITEADEELSALLEKTLLIDGKPANIFGVLAKHPALLKRFNLLGGFILNKGMIPEREREIVILRVGANCKSRYEFGQHTLLGQKCGLSEEEIVALLRPIGSNVWDKADGALINMVDDLCLDDCVSDKTWVSLKDSWNDAEIIELILTAGFYRMVSGFLNSAGIELDEGVPDFPEDPTI
mgnify:FL=1